MKIPLPKNHLVSLSLVAAVASAGMAGFLATPAVWTPHSSEAADGSGPGAGLAGAPSAGEAASSTLPPAAPPAASLQAPAASDPPADPPPPPPDTTEQPPANQTWEDDQGWEDDDGGFGDDGSAHDANGTVEWHDQEPDEVHDDGTVEQHPPEPPEYHPPEAEDDD